MLLTSPSVDWRCRSFRHEAFRPPVRALTSTPLGASMVRVRVGDSSLTTSATHAASSDPSGTRHASTVALTVPHLWKWITMMRTTRVDSESCM